MNKENLLKLADFIENNVRDDQFDVSSVLMFPDYVDDEDCPNYDPPSLLEVEGVTFCAMGLIPIVFPESGVKYKNEGECEYCLNLGDDYDFGIAANLFDMYTQESRRLFSPYYSVDRMDMVKNIREYVDTGELPL